MATSTSLYSSVNLGYNGKDPRSYLEAAQKIIAQETPDDFFTTLEKVHETLLAQIAEITTQHQQFDRFYQAEHPADGSEAVKNATSMKYLLTALNEAILTSTELRGRVQMLRDVKIKVSEAKNKALENSTSGTTSTTWNTQLSALETKVTHDYNKWLENTIDRCKELYVHNAYVCERKNKKYPTYPLARKVYDWVASLRSWVPASYTSPAPNTNSVFIGNYLPCPKEVREQLKKINGLDEETLQLLKLRFLGIYYKAPDKQRGEYETRLKLIDARLQELKMQREAHQEQKEEQPIDKWDREKLTNTRALVACSMEKREGDRLTKAQMLLKSIDMHIAKYKLKEILAGNENYPLERNLAEKLLGDLTLFKQAHPYHTEFDPQTGIKALTAIINCQSVKPLFLGDLYGAVRSLEAVKDINGQDFSAILQDAANRSMDTIIKQVTTADLNTPNALITALAALKRIRRHLTDPKALDHLIKSTRENAVPMLKKYKEQEGASELLASIMRSNDAK